MVSQLKDKNKYGNENKKLFYFKGCAWGCIYYIGVYKKLLQHYSKEELNNFNWGGSSSGCFLPLGIILGKTIDEMQDLFLSFAEISTQYGTVGKNSIYHEYALSKWLPDGGDEFKMLNSKLFICVTKWFNKAELISNWDSNRELKDTIHGSCHIPFYTTHINKVKDEYLMDGSFTEENIIYDIKNIIIISCLIEKADIKPKKLFNYLECIFPPKIENLNDKINRGFLDTAHYLKNLKSEEIKDIHCLDFNIKNGYPNLFILFFWLLRFLEEIDFYVLIGMCIIFFYYI